MTIRTAARAYLRDAITAFNRAPAEIALAVLSAASLSYALENNHQFEAWVQVAIACLIAFMFAWSGTLLHAMTAIDNTRRWVITGIGAVVAAAYLLLVPDLQLESEGWRALVLCASAVVLAMAAPALVRANADPSLRLRRINGRIILRAIGIGLYGLALFAGLALALAAIENLFELKLDEEIYGHTVGWIMLVLVPWVIVGGLESYLAPLDEVSDVARVVQRLTAFLVPPLLALYYVILLMYVVRILITGELPQNLVSPMVIAAGLLTALGAVMFDPRPDATRAGERALRWAPALFLPLAPLGIWALSVRIDQYGWTEFRLLRVLLLVLLFVLAISATVQQIRRRPFALRVIPLVLALPMLLAVVGPWSVLHVSRRDQQGRLAAALREARIDPRAQPADTARRMVPRALYDRITNAGYYLQSHFGEDAVAAVVGTRAAPMAGERGWNLADYLRLAPLFDDTAPATLSGTLAANARVSLHGATLYRVGIPGAGAQVSQDKVLTLRYGAETLHVTLDSLFRLLPPVGGREQGNLPAMSLPALNEGQQVRGELVILEAMVQQTRDSLRVLRLDGVLLIR